MSRVKKLLKLILGLGLTVAAFYFIFSSVWKQKEIVIKHLELANPWLLILGIIFLIFFFLTRSFVWLLILKTLGHTVPSRQALYLLSLSETKRYIPGNIAGMLARFFHFDEFKIPKQDITKALLIESIIFVLSSATISIPGIFILQKSLYQFINPTFLFVGLGVGAGATIILGYVFQKKLRQIGILIKPHVSNYAIIYFLMCVSWFLFGVGNYLIGASLTFLNPQSLLQISSLFALAWLVGYLSFITPMGLGVREAVITAGLSLFIPLSLASAVAIITRIGMVAAEILFLVITKLSKQMKQFPIKLSWQLWTLIAFFVSYSLYFIYVSILKHLLFFTGKFDLGNMDQTIWNTLNGRFFQFTNPDGVENMSRLGAHADFILILLTPFYFVWSDPRMLLIIQTIVIAVGTFFVYLLTFEVLKNKNLALILGVSYLLNPLVQRQNLYDFHAITLATTFLLAAFYFMVKSKWWFFGIFLFLSVLTKENVYLTAGMFGALLFLKGKRLYGTVLFVGGFVLFYLFVSYIIPHFRGSEHFALEFYGTFGETPFEIIKNIVSDPVKTLVVLTSPSQLQYLKVNFLHTGFLALFSPFYLFFTGPDLGISLLSSNPNLRAIWFHYAAPVIPFVYIATIYGILFLNRVNKRIFSYPFFMCYLIISTLFSTWYYGALPGGRIGYVDIYKRNYEYKKQVRDFLKTIPESKSVATSNNLGAHLSHRENLYVLPRGIEKADIVLFMEEKQKFRIPEFEQNPNYKKIEEIDPFVGFERR